MPPSSPSTSPRAGQPPAGEDGAIVLLSGGIDSATCLAIARRDGLPCHALSFDYGQRHRSELDAAAELARRLGAASHRTIRFDLRAIGGSALTADIDVPNDAPAHLRGQDIPVTYVPARNLVFLSLATGLAEVLGAGAIYIGVNAVDYSGYPDCRPAFIEQFRRAALLATAAGVGGRALEIRTPLIAMTKAEIIRTGAALGIDFALTRSCYDPDEAGSACGRCDSCAIRRRGFVEAGIPDPTPYVAAAGTAS